MVMIICHDLWSEAVVILDGADNHVYIFDNKKKLILNSKATFV